MTEIKARKIEIRKGVFRFCAVDNHNRKDGIKSYQIIYKTNDPVKLTEYMYEKGIWQ